MVRKTLKLQNEELLCYPNYPAHEFNTLRILLAL